jgi:hypothetical protein
MSVWENYDLRVRVLKSYFPKYDGCSIQYLQEADSVIVQDCKDYADRRDDFHSKESFAGHIERKMKCNRRYANMIAELLSC